MSLANFKATNHPQQTAKRGASDAVDDRGTDPAFIAQLEERFGKFTIDVAAADHNAKAPAYYTRHDDGLELSWSGTAWWCTDDRPHDYHYSIGGSRLGETRRMWCQGLGDGPRVWCNPPYSNLGAWVRKAWREFGYHDLGVEVNGGSGISLSPNGADDAPDEPKGSVDKADSASTPDLIAMLLPANRVEQAWWQDHVEPFRDRPGSPLRVEFLRGRMRFHRPDWQPGPKGDRPPFGCALLIWGGDS